MTALTSKTQQAAVQRLCRRLGYEFRDTGLLLLALSHRSLGRLNNERLEYLGDAVLGCVIAQVLFERFPMADEGTLSRLRAHLVKGETLACLARGLALGDCLLLGPGERRSGGVQRDSILAGAMEAMMGAVHLDGGVAASRLLILTVFQARLDALSLESAAKDPKTQLQEYLQAKGHKLPIYRLLMTHGEPPDQDFHVACVIADDIAPVSGRGTSRRRAEQAAAAQALQVLDGAMG